MSEDVFSGYGGGIIGDPSRPLPSTRHSQVTADLEMIFTVLRVARRRYLLYHLNGCDDGVMDTDDAVDAVCAYEKLGTEREGVLSREKVRIDLHHAQLPMLEEAGIIDYDSRQGTIRYHGFPPLDEWLEHARHRELD